MNRKQIPNALSVSRMLIALRVLSYAWRGEWRKAFFWLLAGMSTDRADGWAANKFDAITPLGRDVLEPIGDPALMKLAEYGLIRRGEFTWRAFWGINLAGGMCLVPEKVLGLPKGHPWTDRGDTLVGLVYVGEMMYLTRKYGRLADEQTVLRALILGSPLVAWACRDTLARWAKQLA